MFKKLVLFTLTAFVFTGCSTDSEDLENKKALGGIKYGGEFRFMMTDKVATLFSIQAVDAISYRITSQIYEPLFRFKEDGTSVEPLIAESFKVSADQKTYTFKIRKGVFFHEDDCFGGEGREATAEDVKYSLDMACSGMKGNEMAYLLVNRIVGAKDFQRKTKTQLIAGGVSGIIAKGNELIIKLNEPFSSFDKVLAHCGLGVFPKEAFEKYGSDMKNHPVGTGPFLLNEKSETELTLKRNNRYWRKDEFGNQLPYLASIKLTYAKDKKTELMAFRKEESDAVFEIPVDQVNNVLGSLMEAQSGKTVKHKVDVKQSLSVLYVAMNHKDVVLSDVRVRKALNLALDKQTLVNVTLMGEGYPAMNGLIPQSDIYDATKVKGSAFNIASAKALLADAGYPNGKNFPAMEVLTNGKLGSDKYKIAKAFVDQINANLGLNLKVKVVETEVRNNMVVSGKAQLWLSGWIADFPDGSNFLSLFHGDNIEQNSSFLNPYDFLNAEYDNTFNAMNKEFNLQKRTALMNKCDQILVDQAAFIPLISEDFILLINSKMRNFHTNSMENFDFSSIFIKEFKEENSK